MGSGRICPDEGRAAAGFPVTTVGEKAGGIAIGAEAAVTDMIAPEPRACESSHSKGGKGAQEVPRARRPECIRGAAVSVKERVPDLLTYFKP